jgi:hypothetical protein
MLALISSVLAVSSLEGLYVTLPGTGQLERLNWVNGSSTAIGGTLAAKGFSVPSNCTPSAIMQTGKWLSVLAKKTTEHDISPWSIVSIQLESGALTPQANAMPLPSLFSPSLEACDHTIAYGGGCLAFVSAVVGTDATQRLVIASFDWCNKNISIVVNKAVKGARVRFPSSALDDAGVLWFQLATGLVGYATATGKKTKELANTDGSCFTGFHFSIPNQRIYGVLTSREHHSMLASFDPYAVTPALETAKRVIPDVSGGGSATALLSDKVSRGRRRGGGDPSGLQV